MTLFQAIETSFILLALWVAVGAIRRLFFHSLSHIPGPQLAALTWWYEFYYDTVQPGQYVFKIQELHKQYGIVSSFQLAAQVTVVLIEWRSQGPSSA